MQFPTPLLATKARQKNIHYSIALSIFTIFIFNLNEEKNLIILLIKFWYTYDTNPRTHGQIIELPVFGFIIQIFNRFYFRWIFAINLT